jgi:hypothetical protein
MSTKPVDIRLAKCSRNPLSHTRVTCGVSSARITSHKRVTGGRFGGLRWQPILYKRRSHTRVTGGPPLKDRTVLNEGPAQPALRRFGAWTKGALMKQA